MQSQLWVRRILIALVTLTLLAGQSWATCRFFTSRYPGGNDFYARWANGCALIWTGENPYSDEVTRRTQIGMHGHPARPGEDRAAYSYPLYALFFFWPLCFIRTYPLVQAIWMNLMLYALLAGVVIAIRIAKWHTSSWMWRVTLIWSVLNYPHARALILGQLATLVFLGAALSLWALQEDKDALAGMALAVTTIKPQMSLLIVPWVLWWTAWRRRWGVWRGFWVTMGVLIAVSLLLVPTWIWDFVVDVRDYRDSAGTEPCDASHHAAAGVEGENSCARNVNYRSLVWIVTRHFLRLGRTTEVFGLAILALYTAYVCWDERKTAWDGFLWVTSLILIVTNFVAPRTATTHYSMLVLPLFAWFSRLSNKAERHAALDILAIETALLLGQWIIFLTTMRGNYETAPVYLPLPVLLLIVHLLSPRVAHPMLPRGTQC
jgi:hypothetical protein